MNRMWRIFRYGVLGLSFLLLTGYLFTSTPWREKLGWLPKYEGICAQGDPIVSALRRFHEEHGLWPEYLEDLAPAYLPKAPGPQWNYVAGGEAAGWPSLATPTGLPRTNVGFDFSQGGGVWRVFGPDEDRVLRGGPAEPQARAASGPALVEAELAELDRRIEREPLVMEHRRWKVSLLAAAGRIQDAAKETAAAAAAMPEDFWPVLAKAALAMKAGGADAGRGMAELEAWAKIHPSFTHGYYVSVAWRLAGNDDKAIAAIGEAVKLPAGIGEDDEDGLAFYFWDMTRLALEKKQWALVRTLTDAWEAAAAGGEKLRKVRDRSYLPLRAAARLATGDFAGAEGDLQKMEGSYGPMWAGDLDALKAAVARRDQAFVYHPGATPATYSVWARGFAVGAATQAVLESPN